MNVFGPRINTCWNIDTLFDIEMLDLLQRASIVGKAYTLLEVNHS